MIFLIVIRDEMIIGKAKDVDGNGCARRNRDAFYRGHVTPIPD